MCVNRRNEIYFNYLAMFSIYWFLQRRKAESNIIRQLEYLYRSWIIKFFGTPTFLSNGE